MKVDVTNHEDTIAKMKSYDIVMEGTTIKVNGLSTHCIAEAFENPQIIFDELEKCNIHIHEEVFTGKENYNFV